MAYRKFKPECVECQYMVEGKNGAAACEVPPCVEQLEAKIKIVCTGIPSPNYEAKKKSMAEGIMSVDISKTELAFHVGWEAAMLECGEILSKPLMSKKRDD